MNPIQEPLRTVLQKYCHVETYCPQLLKEAINSGNGFPYDVALFKSQLREAIDNQSISPDEYEKITEEDFDSQEDLQAWLEELWSEIP